MRTFTLLGIALLLVLPQTLAATEETLSVSPSIELLTGDTPAAVSYRHDDCVGPGLPGTAPSHLTHTTRVSGFVISGRPVNMGVIGLTPFGAGPCPAMANLGVLPQDFTGTIRLTLVCRGTINDGATLATWTVSFVAGLVTSNTFVPGTCTGYLNTPFSIDVTTALSSTSPFAGVPLGPIGGVSHTLSQA